MEEQALWVRDRDCYVGTILTQGGWDPDAANGGAVLALLGQHLDGVPSLVPMTLSRLTADLIRPVPIGRRLRIVDSILRDGKKIQLVELRVLADDLELARVSALRLRDADLTGHEVPASTSTERPGDSLVAPEASLSFRRLAPDAPGFLQAVDMRRAPTIDGTGVGAWIRLDVPVVAGEPVNATARITFGFDFANLVGMIDHPRAMTLINPDVTAHVLRPPVSDWIAITGTTRFNPGMGRGVSSAELSDTDGVYATVSMSQLIQPR